MRSNWPVAIVRGIAVVMPTTSTGTMASLVARQMNTTGIRRACFDAFLLSLSANSASLAFGLALG